MISRSRRVLSRLAVTVAVFTAVLGALMFPGTAHAAAADRGAGILAVAETRAGAPYVWAAAGPWAFDCSGLVSWAAARTGISLPHSTYAMLASGHLVPTRHPVAGDLAFFGAGHVEFVARGHNMTFGAQNSGTRVGFHQWSSWWHPTMFFKVV
jgi:cell wall-associated NlpC family hydrolase